MATSDIPLPKRLQTPVPCNGCDTGAPGKHYCTICRKTMCNNCHSIHAKLLQNHKVVPRSNMVSTDNSMSEDQSEIEKVKAELDRVNREIRRVHADIMQKLTETERRDLERVNNVKEFKREGKTIIGLILILIPLSFIGVLRFSNTSFIFPYEKPALVEELSVVIEELLAQHVDALKLDLSGIRKDLNFLSISLNIYKPEIISSFPTEVQGDYSICITSDGYAWIGGQESRELILVDINGKIYNRRKVQHRTYHLVMMASGDFIIKPRLVDSYSIIRLGRDGTETNIFDTAPFLCNGVSVTRDEKILMSTKNGRLMACNSDGTNVQEIYKNDNAGGLIHAIELPDKTICFSDWSNKRLVLIDKDGQQITTITRPLGRTNYYPVGLACDRMGNILSTDWNNDCVYIIDQDRRVKELVGPSHGIKNPSWIDIDKDDNLWIAQDEGTITVVKYLT